MEKGSSFVEITILNWEKYNSPNFRSKHPSWFCVHQNICFSQSLLGLSAEQKWLWINILSECCRKKTSTIKLRVKWLMNATGVSVAAIEEAIEILSENEAIKIISRAEINNDSDFTPTQVGVNTTTDRQTDRQTLIHANKEFKECLGTNKEFDKEPSENLGTNKEFEARKSSEVDKSPPPPPPPGGSLPSLVDIWNNNATNLPKCLRLSAKRNQQWSRRWQENPHIDYWAAVIRRLNASDFCCGSTGWKATVDFLLRPDTALKVMEGNYDNKKTVAQVLRLEV